MFGQTAERLHPLGDLGQHRLGHGEPARRIGSDPLGAKLGDVGVFPAGAQIMIERPFQGVIGLDGAHIDGRLDRGQVRLLTRADLLRPLHRLQLGFQFLVARDFLISQRAVAGFVDDLLELGEDFLNGHLNVAFQGDSGACPDELGPTVIGRGTA